MNDVSALLGRKGLTIASGAPEGVDALLIAKLARARQSSSLCLVMKDDAGIAKMAEMLGFFAPDVDVLEFPAWDCVPYDRVSPHVDVVAKRIDTLTKLVANPVAGKPSRVVITSISAILQRVAPRQVYEGTSLAARVGASIPGDKILTFLTRNGYSRTDTVMEPGEFALRGGIIDLFPPGEAEPLRLDFFGDELEAIRSFDPMTQRTTAKMEGITLAPVAEVLLDDASISRFRTRYRELFGIPSATDPLYEAISAGTRFNGMEHWLPLFHEGADTLFAFLSDDSPLIFDYQVEDAAEARWSLILEYFEARRAVEGGGRGESGMVYHPLAPTALYLDKAEWRRLCATRAVIQLSPFKVPEGEAVVEIGGLGGRDFADIRSLAGSNVYDALKTHIDDLHKAGMRVVLASWTAGSRDRMANVLADHGVTNLDQTEVWVDAPPDLAQVSLVVQSLEHGFRWGKLAVITEQDVLGDRMARPARKKKRGAQFLAEAASLAEGDLVVHVEHGIGRYDGLETLQIAGAAHDCLRVLYDGNDKLFVPVENLDVLSRYGSDQMGVQLDRLGGAAWQSRKAKLKKRIQDMAAQLIAIAAERLLRKGEPLSPPEGAWDEFCARFPFVETEDQLRAIEDIVADLSSGRPMDRLICGDVGFGKTEVALRTAFIAAMAGMQVAVVVPTTLLARQHYRTFVQRFEGLPVRIGQLSRLVAGKTAAENKAGVIDGSLDIVVGTHAVLAKTIQFKRLGLLIIDEEQHFGVAHKERLKQMKADVHVLTLSATPIPRTMQMALTGVKEMSIIATPPVDRTAVRTFVLPYDPVVLREAILRERYRGGQIFYVCPRLADIDRVAERLQALVPEVTYAIAHGRLSPTELEDVMNAFGERRYDVLLSTNIVESGLDMPSVNTLIIHRADMFGLGQLYQLRGRVGRSKIRGYAYLTLPNDRVLSDAAGKRLHVMQSLDSLGAGFQLASHDLDIRGAGNLLGDEQSGHIREVGIELYQTLLEEAVAAAKAGEGGMAQVEWSPQIAIGTPVLIPEEYVKDLGLRLSLYRRIADLVDKEDIENLRAEMVDRFGKLPDEVKNLLQVIMIKALCKKANIAKLDAGPKGAVITFRDNSYPNPAGLVGYIAQQTGTLKLRPDHKLVMIRNWEDPKIRVDGVTRLASTLADLAAQG